MQISRGGLKCVLTEGSQISRPTRKDLKTNMIQATSSSWFKGRSVQFSSSSTLISTNSERRRDEGIATFATINNRNNNEVSSSSNSNSVTKSDKSKSQLSASNSFSSIVRQCTTCKMLYKYSHVCKAEQYGIADLDRKGRVEH